MLRSMHCRGSCSHAAVALHTNAIDFPGTLTYRWRQVAGQAVEILEPVRFRLAAVDKSGAPITSARVGEPFVLNAYVRDTQPNAKGVFSAYLDLRFDPQLCVLKSHDW